MSTADVLMSTADAGTSTPAGTSATTTTAAAVAATAPPPPPTKKPRKRRRFKKLCAAAILALSLGGTLACVFYWERIEPLFAGTEDPYCPVYTPLPGEAGYDPATAVEYEALSPLDSAIYGIEVALERADAASLASARYMYEQIAATSAMENRTAELDAMRQGIADAEQTYKLAAARRTADLWAGKPSSPEEDVTSSDNSDSDGVSSSVRVDSGGDTSSL